MANTFKNYTGSSVGQSEETVYTVPAGTTSVVIGCNLANVSSSQVTVSVKAAHVYIVKDAAIPSGSALSVLDGKVILQETHPITVESSAADSIDIIVSVLEQT
jgi:hypothetical protein